ncbi:hypothetical protein J2X36_001934 [Methylobacterium sp. BE186]|uniref:hypothetical protein n=1 Tax=Methylobacterium sp. BE186 TaxID=2817715 RepID=UPI0028669464|nr:hypothetical protein [Methylobacterium sp. BE186]MDR7037190.1 hypothetical protein [Methylobacterium sp. BE186]
MSNVVALPPVPKPPEPGSGQHPSLRILACRVGYLIHGLLAAGSVLFGAILVLGLVFDGALLWLAPDAAYLGLRPDGVDGLVSFGSLPWPTRLAYAASFILSKGPILLVLAEMRRWLSNLAAGLAFAPSDARRLRRMALWLAAYSGGPLLGHALVRIAGNGVDLAWFQGALIPALVLAAVLVVVAELLRVGHAVEQDRNGFV